VLTGDQYTSTIYPLWIYTRTINHAARISLRISFLCSYPSPLSFANIQIFGNRNLTTLLSVARLQLTWFISFVVWIRLCYFWNVNNSVLLLFQFLCKVFFMNLDLSNAHFFWFFCNILSCSWQSVSLVYEHTLVSPKSVQEK